MLEKIRFIAALAALPLLLVAVSAPAYAIDCGKTPPRIDVIQLQKPTEFVRNFTSTGLTKMHEGNFRMDAPSVLGLGGGPMSLKLDTVYETKREGSVSCVRPGGISITFTITPVIMIARNYEKGSCEYEAVLTHEQKHIDAFSDFQTLYADKLKAYVARIARERIRAKVVSNVNVAFEQKQMDQTLKTALDSYLETMQEALYKRQMKIDSPQEYAHVAAQCSNW